MELVSATERHMNTDVSITLSVKKQNLLMAKYAVARAFSKIQKLEKEISEFHPASPIFTFNQSAPQTRISVPDSVIDLLRLSLRLREKTQSAFDPLCKSQGPASLGMDLEKGLVWKETAETHLGFGAIGKGYILDKVRLSFQQEGLEDFVINAGGSSIILSGFLLNEPSRWAWSWKKQADRYLGKEFLHTSGKCIALGVSGNMEQGLHIKNRDSTFAQSTLSALVAHPSAAVADALSTALFVHGWRDLEMFQDSLAFMPMALIDQEENVKWNGHFSQAWGNPC